MSMTVLLFCFIVALFVLISTEEKGSLTHFRKCSEFNSVDRRGGVKLHVR